MKQTESKWYATWFDTPYYHILYKNRDDKEAQNFMLQLTDFLKLKPQSHILDVACGRGRHSIYLNKIGYRVTGIDLSQNNIDYAKKFETDGLHFERHDMCQPMGKTYDAVFNLFTSFGYFEKDDYNINAIKAMKANMKPDAFGVIDFLNVHHTLKHLKKYDAKTIDGIDFKIHKWIDKGYILKHIQFEVDNQKHDYTERLKCIDLKLFKSYFKVANLNIKHVFGNYNLEDFDAETSERLILVFNQ
ncbi:cyclopropane-fatty-acyl-phospholipid synthase family protein [Flavobacterium sp. CS20]|uniref:SAM-dependent methyltransferase n=1 Tax=Flavobacterium sp. CS20 TaxID=2775246 RepID=UPI001B39DF84|nr:class I SAM-dependent methyltransferase [Flavobacterium sp. CS20]QTY27856.1 methyltransferase domain-containing protein [Flavobacterium sp. CS20]